MKLSTYLKYKANSLGLTVMVNSWKKEGLMFIVNMEVSCLYKQEGESEPRSRRLQMPYAFKAENLAGACELAVSHAVMDFLGMDRMMADNELKHFRANSPGLKELYEEEPKEVKVTIGDADVRVKVEPKEEKTAEEPPKVVKKKAPTKRKKKASSKKTVEPKEEPKIEVKVEDDVFADMDDDLVLPEMEELVAFDRKVEAHASTFSKFLVDTLGSDWKKNPDHVTKVKKVLPVMSETKLFTTTGEPRHDFNTIVAKMLV